MNFRTDILLVIIVVELFILLSLLLFIIFRRMISYFQIQKSHKNKKKIAAIVSDYLTNAKSFDSTYQYKAFSVKRDLLEVMEAFNHRFKGYDWKELKTEIVKRYLLPKARKWAKSFFWTRRNFAVRCFVLASLQEDEAIIIHLIDDPIFFVASIASLVAVELESKEGTMKVLEYMSKERGYARYFYQDILLQGSAKIFSWIGEVASRKENKEIHLASLEILAGKTMLLHLSFLEEDLQSEDKQIRLAALKVFINNSYSDSVKILLKGLEDPEESIRAEAAKRLENFVNKETLQKLEQALQDPFWVVRLEAARTLKKIGKEGIDLLKQQKIKGSKESYEAAQYVLQFS